jgi:mono/diheme cytochrome c family protein
VRRLVVVFVLLAACGSEGSRPTREWTPADHQPPEGEQSDRSGAPDEVDADPAATEARAAAALFNAMCAQCHGMEGRGDGPGRPPVAQVPDFQAAAFQSGRTDEQLAEVIANGRGGFMPAFGARISGEGIAALVRHVRRLGGAPPTPPPSAPAP